MIQDHSALLLGVHWVWTAISTLFVAGRLYGRTHDGIKLGWEDLWIIPALCCSYSMSIIATLFSHDGATEPATMWPAGQVDNFSRLNYVYQLFALLGLTTGKISVMCLIKRLQSPTRWRTIVLWALGVVLAAYNCVQIILQFFQCNNLLDSSLGRCVHSAAILYNALAGAIWNAVVDLALVAIPLHMIWHLNMPARRKAAVGTVLSTGLFPFCMAIVKISSFFGFYNGSDLSWSLVLLFVWNACEINSIIIAACIPTLAPLYRALRGQQSTRRHYTYFRSDIALPTNTLSPTSGRSGGSRSTHSRTMKLDPIGKAVVGRELEETSEDENWQMRTAETGLEWERESEEGLIAYSNHNAAATREC